MSQANVEVVRRIIDALGGGDLDSALESTTPDFEADWSNSRGVERGVYRGRDQVRESLRSSPEAWASLEWEVKEFVELRDEQVLIVSQLRMRGLGSEVEVAASGASIWTFRNGRAAGFTLYQSRAEALEAAGAL
jgi:ketosteroid isomerase-like protein